MYMLIIKLVQFSNINGIFKKKDKKNYIEKDIIFKEKKNDRSKALIKKRDIIINITTKYSIKANIMPLSF